MPSLNALRIFDVASRHANFRLAADALGITHSAVAQQIRKLEGELGVRLFERQTRTLVLTENGKRYAASVRQAFALLSDATGALQPQPRHLTISVTPTFASKWLIPRLPDFTNRHPAIDLRVLATDRLSHFQTSLAIEAAVAGQGLALAHRAYVEVDIAAGRLVRVFSQALHTGAGFYLVAPRHARRAVAEVSQWLSGQGAADAVPA